VVEEVADAADDELVGVRREETRVDDDPRDARGDERGRRARLLDDRERRRAARRPSSRSSPRRGS
jgi:hypothetical protein